MRHLGLVPEIQDKTIIRQRYLHHGINDFGRLWVLHYPCRNESAFEVPSNELNKIGYQEI
jgi:hypothetical protein